MVCFGRTWCYLNGQQLRCRYIPGLYPWILERSEGLYSRLCYTEQEAAQESYADAYTAAQKEATAKLKLWELYDAAQKAEGKTKTSAIKKYERVAAKLDNQIEKILKAKSNF